MVWRRLPSYLPNIGLKLIPLSEAQQKVFETTGFLKEIVFKTAPSVSKVSRRGGRRDGGRGTAAATAAAAGGARRRRQLLLLRAVQVEIKHFLESVYGLHVEKVNTLNVEGKKKRGKFGFFRWALPACLTLAGSSVALLPGRLAGCFALRAGKIANSCQHVLLYMLCCRCCRRPDYKKAFVVLNEQPRPTPPTKAAKPARA